MSFKSATVATGGTTNQAFVGGSGGPHSTLTRMFLDVVADKEEMSGGICCGFHKAYVVPTASRDKRDVSGETTLPLQSSQRRRCQRRSFQRPPPSPLHPLLGVAFLSCARLLSLFVSGSASLVGLGQHGRISLR